MNELNYGINIQRRKRQADENTKIVLERFISDIQNNSPIIEEEFCIKSIDKMQYWVDKFADKAKGLAKTIEVNWAIPILIESIGRLYYGDIQEYKDFGPVYKSAIAYLWGVNSPIKKGTMKNINSLVQLLKLCYMIESINSRGPFFYIREDYSFSINNGYIDDGNFKDSIIQFKSKIAGRGMRLRIAEENNSVMNNPEFIIAIQDILINNKKPSEIGLFSDLFYKYIPGAEDDSCREFWQTLFFRTTLYYAVSVTEIGDGMMPGVCIFPEFPVELTNGLCTQDVVTSTFWRTDWFSKQMVSRYSHLIVERPVLRITNEGEFATSACLIGDSINLYVEDSILGYTERLDRAKLPDEVFKKAISEVFEERIIDKLVDLDFMAGHVSEKGIWNKRWLENEELKQTTEDLRFDDDTKLYGEVDAFALREDLDLAIIIECKVIHDYRSLRTFKNMNAKLKEESEGFRNKLNSKGDWLEKALEKKKNKKIKIVKVLLTDISMPVEDDSEDIILADENTLVSALSELMRGGEM